MMLNFKTILGLFLLLYAVYASAALPGKISKIDANAVFLAKMADNSNQSFNSLGQIYRILKSGYAIHQGDNSKPLKAGQNLNWSQKLGNYQIIIPRGNTPTVQPKNAKFYQIAYNNNSKNLGILTGRIIVKFKTKFAAEEIANAYQLNISSQFARLNVAFFTPKNGDIVSINQQLKQNNALEYARIEVLENIKIPY